VSSTASTERQAAGRPTERLPPDDGGLARAAQLLASGGLVAFPTETVYGLGADGRSPAAVDALYAAKGRPRFNPLIAHVASLDQARAEGVFDLNAEALAQALWPGPLTLVAPLAAAATVCDFARSGLRTIGLRVPAHPVARHLLQRCGFPVVAPSANLSGRVSPTEAAHVLDDLDGRIDAVVEGGNSAVGLESTIVACLGGASRLLRPGAITRAELEAVLGQPVMEAEGCDAPIAPGALASHYAPRAKVRLDAREIRPGEAALVFGHAAPDAGCAVASLNLSPSGSLREAASNLFGHLRRLDASGAHTISVTPIPDHGIGAAINDRLRRSAAPRG